MATVKITDKPIADKIDEQSYVLGTQPDKNGQAALHRFAFGKMVADIETATERANAAANAADNTTAGEHITVENLSANPANVALEDAYQDIVIIDRKDGSQECVFTATITTVHPLLTGHIRTL